MLKTDRLKQIEEILNRNGKVEVASLCRIFNVTEMTIRRDLNTLVEQKIAIRAHGGAILSPGEILTERPYNLRICHNLKEKEAIAKLALPLINNGDKVFFDSSTTVFSLARLVTNEQNFLAVTDTISTALEVNGRTNVKVVCLGGELKKSTCSCTGVFAETMLKDMYFDLAFLGLPNISPEGVLSTSSMEELSIKKLVIAHAKRTIVLVDSTKLGTPDFLNLGHVSDIDTLITDANMPQAFLDLCNRCGVKTLVAKLS